MTIKRKFKSAAFEAIHSAVSGMHRVGNIDRATMRDFDVSCIAMPLKIEAAQIKKLRERNHVSRRGARKPLLRFWGMTNFWDKDAWLDSRCTWRRPKRWANARSCAWKSRRSLASFTRSQLFRKSSFHTF
jgi:hypothetical protein